MQGFRAFLAEGFGFWFGLVRLREGSQGTNTNNKKILIAAVSVTTYAPPNGHAGALHPITLKPTAESSTEAHAVLHKV